MLGPFARAIQLILKYVELNRQTKIPFGMDFDISGDPLGAFSQSFMLFRGTSMSKDIVDTWRDQVSRETVNSVGDSVARPVQLKGNTSTSESFKVALQFSQDTVQETWMDHNYKSGQNDNDKQ